jgi:hypothetical protein
MENAYQKGRYLSILKSQPEIADARGIAFRGDPATKGRLARRRTGRGGRR